MKLSKKQKLGLDLFHFLGIEPLTVAVLATYLSTTEDFLQQIVRDLRAASLITVKKGPGGGVSLNPESFAPDFNQVISVLGVTSTVSDQGTNSAKVQALVAEALTGTLVSTIPYETAVTAPVNDNHGGDAA